MPEEYVALDLETTGLLPERDTIVEIAALRFTARRVLSEFSALVNPGRPIPTAATRIHGISNRQVRGRASTEQALRSLVDFLGPSPCLLVAHNAPFDFGFLAWEMRRLGLPFPPHRVVDSLGLARELVPESRSKSLAALAVHLDIRLEGHHRALQDTRALVRIFRRMLARMPGSRRTWLARQAVPFDRWLPRPISAPEGFEDLDRASRVEILYDRQGPATRQRVRPLQFMEVEDSPSLLAVPEGSEEPRRYRLNAIRGLRDLSAESGKRPSAPLGT